MPKLLCKISKFPTQNFEGTAHVNRGVEMPKAILAKARLSSRTPHASAIASMRRFSGFKWVGVNSSGVCVLQYCPISS